MTRDDARLLALMLMTKQGEGRGARSASATGEPNAFDQPSSGADQAAFLRGEKDTRPYWETEHRATLMPLVMSGYNNRVDYGVPALAGGSMWGTLGDIVSGKSVTKDEIKHAAEQGAGAAMIGSPIAVAAAPKVNNAVGMFVGTKAATADRAALAKAQAAEAAGVPREQIWTDHGWFKGVDGKWRTEIDDSGAKLTEAFPAGYETTLGRRMRHDKLYDAFPDLKDAPYRSLPLNGDKLGSFNGNTIGFVDGFGDLQTKTALHEMQHWVQRKEGFARGSNPALEGVQAEANDPVIARALAAYQSAKTKHESAFGTRQEPTLAADRKAAHEAYTDAIRTAPQRTKQIEEDLYRRTSGEVEARATETRRHFTEPERRARAPWLDYDVPESQQIVKGIFSNREGAAAAPLAVEVGKKTVEPRSLDSLGYYSAALEAAKSWQQRKGTPEQALAWLKKSGVKAAEIEATGVGSAFADRPSVTREDLVKLLGDNRVRVIEVRHGATRTDDELTAAQNRLADAMLGDDYTVAQRRKVDEFVDMVRWSSVERDDNTARIAAVRDQQPPHIRQMIDDLMGGEKDSKWSRYSLDPNNPTYRETVLHLPETRRIAIDKRLMDINEEISRFTKHLTRDVPEEHVPRFRELRAEAQALSAERADLLRSAFKSGHFSEPNIVGHTQSSMVKHDGKPTYLLDQIQSDWGQKLRKGGVRDEAKIADLRRQIEVKNREADAKAAPGRELLIANDIVNDAERAVPNAPWERIMDWLGYAKRVPDAEKLSLELLRMRDDIALLNAELKTAEASATGHPLVNTTDQWTSTVLRNAVRAAIDSGAENIAIPSGKTVLSYNPGDFYGMGVFYDQIVPKNLANVLGRLDKGGITRQQVSQLETPTRGMAGDGFSLFPITPRMREEALKGMPLFANREGAAVLPLMMQGQTETDKRNALLMYLLGAQ